MSKFADVTGVPEFSGTRTDEYGDEIKVVSVSAVKKLRAAYEVLRASEALADELENANEHRLFDALEESIDYLEKEAR
jgi:hypothetical protein